MTTFSIKHITKKYPSGHIALNDLSLELTKKEFLVISGPSGSGKTTLLHTIAGLIKLDQGEILLDDQVIDNQKDIAMVFQDAALFEHWSVFHNIAIGLKEKGYHQKEIKEMVINSAKQLSIDELINRKCSTLSGGQKQRVAIARALVRKPKLFLMDEPLSSLDANLRYQLRLEILKLYQREDATFIYVTHDQREAMSMGTQVLLMDQGKLIQKDDPSTMYHQPNHLFTLKFYCDSQINILPGFIQDGYLYALTQKVKTTLIDSRVQLAIRPNKIIISEENHDFNGIGVIEFIEQYMDHTLIHARYQEYLFLIETNQDYHVGQQVPFAFSLSDSYLFDELGNILK